MYERPDCLAVLHAACAQAEKSAPFGGEFAGSWVLKELARVTGPNEWKPGLRRLVSYEAGEGCWVSAPPASRSLPECPIR